MGGAETTTNRVTARQDLGVPKELRKSKRWCLCDGDRHEVRLDETRVRSAEHDQK